jgi:hypothetical protein
VENRVKSCRDDAKDDFINIQEFIVTQDIERACGRIKRHLTRMATLSTKEVISQSGGGWTRIVETCKPRTKTTRMEERNDSI